MALICPLLKEDCKEHKCGWWDRTSTKCGIAGIAEAIAMSS